VDEENIVMEVTKQDVRGPRRDTDVTCWDFARRCVDLILSCTFMVVAFLQPCDKTNWKSFETVSLFHQTMGYWKFVVWLSSNSKVNLEAGKDKELFYKKTRLAWATWPARVGRLNTTTSTELEIPLFNKPVHMLFVWGPFRPRLFACFFFVSMFFVKCSFWGVFGILVIFRCKVPPSPSAVCWTFQSTGISEQKIHPGWSSTAASITRSGEVEEGVMTAMTIWTLLGCKNYPPKKDRNLWGGECYQATSTNKVW